MGLKKLILFSMHDSEHIRRNTVFQIVIVTLAFILLCCIWPSGMVQRHTKSVQQAFSSTKNLSGDTFTSADKKLQTVRFTNNHLYSIKLYLSCNENYDENNDYVIFRLYDDHFSCVYEEMQGFGLIEKRGAFLATPDIDVDINSDYFYEILVPEEAKGSVALPVAERAVICQRENTILYVDGIYREDISLVADFDYTKALTIFHIIGYDFLILVIGIFCYISGICFFYHFEEQLDTFYLYLKRISIVLAVLIAIVFFVFAVVMNGFGGEVADRFVYAIATIVFVLWLYCALWIPGRKKKISKLRADRQASIIWRNYIQTVSFGLLFYSLCQYVNADIEYYHYVNTRWMLIFLGIAFMMMQSGKKLCNYLSVVWLVIGISGAVIYCNVVQDEQELYLAGLLSAVIVIWGLVLIKVLTQVKKDFWKSIDWPLFSLWLIFTIFMYINRFEKVWVFVATLPFLTLFFLDLTPAEKSRLLKNFTNGILLSFGLVMLFCLVHRPYHYWMRYRYNGIFHTVACTGMYLAVIAGAVIGKLYGKWKKNGNLLQNGKLELFILAAVASNIFLSMSRTAMLTFGVTLVLTAILSAISFEKNAKRIFHEVGVIGVAIVISFPLMYSMIRVVPAIINEPIRYELEPQERSYMIYEGDKIDSDKYMTIRRCFSVFFGRFQSEDEARNEMDADTLLAYMGKDMLPVSASCFEDGEEASESKTDLSNGRIDIYKDYIRNLSISGHEKMSPEGTSYGHAHNSYLQVAYDFGLVAGIAFLLLCAVTLWRTVMLGFHQGRHYSIYFVPFSLVVVFGFISLTEWAFSPCIPAGFAFLFIQMLLMRRSGQYETGGEMNKGRS